jgi:diguanylate cyclase (GGDEF)-like protein
VEWVTAEPGLPLRFLDEATGEPLRTFFSSFSPCRTPEELAASLAPIRDQLLERTGATDVRFHVTSDVDGSLLPIPFWDREPAEFTELDGRVRTQALEHRRTLHVPDLAARGTGAAPTDEGALLSIPLLSGDRLTGLMEVVRATPGPFPPEELQFFSLASLVAAGMMVRAEVLEKLIFLDKLTGLYNRAYFDDQIEREIERANRSGSSVALLMADLDHFKRVNDTFGHQVGDQVLSHFGSIIRANIRQIDVAARYGGEEFAILLPSTTRSRADLTAERLRRVVFESKLERVAPALSGTRISVSVGVALYPDDAGTAKQLIDRADRVALYAAKKRGRNRVVSWAEAQGTNEKLRQ